MDRVASVVPGTTGAPAASAARRALVFEPISSIASGGGPMKTSPASFDRARERGVLGEEAVAGVDRLGAALERGLDDAVDPQIALGRRRGAEQVSLVREAHVQRRRVRLRIDGDRRDAHLAARAQNPHRDLAAVGDKNLFEHRLESDK